VYNVHTAYIDILFVRRGFDLTNFGLGLGLVKYGLGLDLDTCGLGLGVSGLDSITAPMIHYVTICIWH